MPGEEDQAKVQERRRCFWAIVRTWALAVHAAREDMGVVMWEARQQQLITEEQAKAAIWALEQAEAKLKETMSALAGEKPPPEAGQT